MESSPRTLEQAGISRLLHQKMLEGVSNIFTASLREHQAAIDQRREIGFKTCTGFGRDRLEQGT